MLPEGIKKGVIYELIGAGWNSLTDYILILAYNREDVHYILNNINRSTKNTIMSLSWNKFD